MDFHRLFKNAQMKVDLLKSRLRGPPIDSLCVYQETAPFITVSNMVFIRI
jgi:hypothetical protein